MTTGPLTRAPRSGGARNPRAPTERHTLKLANGGLLWLDEVQTPDAVLLIVGGDTTEKVDGPVVDAMLSKIVERYERDPRAIELHDDLGGGRSERILDLKPLATDVAHIGHPRTQP